MHCTNFERKAPLSRSRLSRRIGLLEDRLCVRLIPRSTRCFAVTGAGRDYQWPKVEVLLGSTNRCADLIECTWELVNSVRCYTSGPKQFGRSMRALYEYFKFGPSDVRVNAPAKAAICSCDDSFTADNIGVFH
jgi:hypothetical protein